MTSKISKTIVFFLVITLLCNVDFTNGISAEQLNTSKKGEKQENFKFISYGNHARRVGSKIEKKEKRKNMELMYTDKFLSENETSGI